MWLILLFLHFLQQLPSSGKSCIWSGHCKTGQACFVHVNRFPLHRHFTHGSSESVTSRPSKIVWPFSRQPVDGNNNKIIGHNAWVKNVYMKINIRVEKKKKMKKNQKWLSHKMKERRTTEKREANSDSFPSIHAVSALHDMCTFCDMWVMIIEI